MDTVLSLQEKYGNFENHSLHSGIVIRRFAVGEKALADNRCTKEFNLWYPGVDSLTTSDALRGLSLSSWTLAVLVNLRTNHICYSTNETEYSFFNFPIDSFLAKFPTFKISLSPDFTHDTLAIRGFCHATLHVNPYQNKTKKQIWKDARNWLIGYVKDNPREAFTRLPEE